MADAKEHRTVSRVTDILEMVAAATHGGLRLMDIAANLDAPRSSVHGLIKGLEAKGYLMEQSGRYRIGNAVSALLESAPSPVAELARRAMPALLAQFDETVMLGTRVGDSLVYLGAVESTQLIRYSAPLRQRRPLYPTSSGRCFLAFSAHADRERYLREHVAPERRDEVLAEFERVRKERVAVNPGDTVPDVIGVSAPVCNGEGVAVTLSIAGPRHRMLDQLPALREAVSAAAASVQISTRAHG